MTDFARDFPDDDACLTYLWRARLSPDGVHARCPRCGEVRPFRRYGTAQRRRSWTCTVCGQHLHPTAGTIFEKSSTSLRLWFYAAFVLARTDGGVTARDLQRVLGVSYKTAWRMRSVLAAAIGGQGDGWPAALARSVEPGEETPDAPTDRPGPAASPEPIGLGPADAAIPRHNLPVPLTRFVGRQQEVRAVTRLMARARLVTLVGPGGCGKTRVGASGHLPQRVGAVGVQALDRHRGQVSAQRRPGHRDGGRGRPGGQDRAHVLGGERTELHRPSQRRREGVASVGRFQRGDRADVGGKTLGAGRGDRAQERLRLVAEGHERLLHRAERPHRPLWLAGGPVVVFIHNGRAARRDELVRGDLQPLVPHLDPVLHCGLILIDLAADQGAR